MAEQNQNFIRIKGARVHNLKNISVAIPKNKLVVITGLSGSGKSSLAFDTIYAEAERRFVESLSSYARQFLGVREKPEVEEITGLSPAIAIDQRGVAKNPRSTVGTITEIYDYLRILFSRFGKASCPNCGRPLKKQTVDEMIKIIFKFPRNGLFQILSPLARGKKGEYRKVIEGIKNQGFLRVRIDKEIMKTEEALSLKLDKNKKHSIDIVIDRVYLDETLESGRLRDSLEQALRLGKGTAIGLLTEQNKNEKEILFSENFACPHCEISFPAIEPRLFSFNSPFGACGTCAGLGKYLKADPSLIMPNKNLSLAEGAIFPWAHASHRVGRQGWYWWMLENLAEKHKFSLNEPIKNLSKKITDIILYGDPENEFEGVIPNLERRWRETDSEWTREELERFMREKICESCNGARLKPEALAVKIEGKNIAEFALLPANELFQFVEKIKNELKKQELKAFSSLFAEILKRIKFLLDVGLDYLCLSREASTLSGGEIQRVRLATQIGSGLSGVIYVLDEPSIGLHPRDHRRLIETLKNLRDLQNTVIVIEHDRDTMQNADWIIDLGPGAGEHGGKIIFEGDYKKILKSKTLTGDYLSGKKKIFFPINKKKTAEEKFLAVKGASQFNLKNIDAAFPLGKLVGVSGVSGSGKSTLVNEILAKALKKHFYGSREEPGKHRAVEGLKDIDKVVVVDQSPIGRTPRSNPATYTGAFHFIRELFSETPEARSRGYKPGRFSFNVKGGRCEECEGQGVKKIEMYFLPDIYVVCEECGGSRYNKEALSILYNNKNISEALNMSAEEAYYFFRNIPPLKRVLNTLVEVGLDYIKLGQSATTLSGGEAQRIKLATELAKKETHKTLYILDEPTTGLHFEDIRKLLGVLKALVEKENTVIVIEHNLDVLKNCDYLIDLGPEGGEKGGEIVAQGTPEEIRKNKKSYTGFYLLKYK